MKRKILGTLLTFVLILLLHAVYSIRQTLQASQQWAQFGNTPLWFSYFTRQDFFMGFSYALAGAFTVYALLKFSESKKICAAGVIGGVTLIGVLNLAGCFLLGCCGSPMLAVYLSLFGSSFLGFTKPLVAAITTTSVILGYIWLEKKSPDGF